MEVFERLDAERSFNVIDQILLEDSLHDATHGGAVVKARATLNKAYGRIGTSGSNDTDSDDDDFIESSRDSPVYAEQTEFGYVGFEAPLG
jgi:hypothetical protein